MSRKWRPSCLGLNVLNWLGTEHNRPMPVKQPWSINQKEFTKYGLIPMVWINRNGPGIPKLPQIARFMGSTWGPPGSCRPQMGPMLAPWTLLSETLPLRLTRKLCMQAVKPNGVDMSMVSVDTNCALASSALVFWITDLLTRVAYRITGPLSLINGLFAFNSVNDSSSLICSYFAAPRFQHTPSFS